MFNLVFESLTATVPQLHRSTRHSRPGASAAALGWSIALLAVVGAGFVATARAAIDHATLLTAQWSEVLADARGQRVYFHAWGGGDRINQYIDWVADELEARHGVQLEHVKVTDIAESIAELDAARAVGRDTDGNIDLMWVNGENFAALKHRGLLLGAFAGRLPNARLLSDSPALHSDFSEPVEDLESPWGGAQLVFIRDSAVVEDAPDSAAELLAYLKDGGRFAYPAPPDFHGTTFVKQLLLELIDDRDRLAKPVDESDFDAVTAPLWRYLDALHPLLHGKGRSWPASIELTRQMLDDGEVDLSLSFNPNDASAAVRAGQLPDTVRTHVFSAGTIGNTHYVTIPFNASAAAGAMVAANFLLSPEAQARKADPVYWGDPTVLDVAALPDAGRALFAAIDTGPWALPMTGTITLPEPHVSWTTAIEAAWLERYTD